MTNKYKVSLHVEQEIYADDEDEALAIFHGDLLENWSAQELAEIRRLN
jgi:hypothetical protein